MKKVLSICKEPKVSVYAHHAYLHAIMESEDRVSDELYRLRIKDYDQYSWEFGGSNPGWEKEADELALYGEKYSSNNESFVMRNLNETDSLSIDILHWTFTQGDNVINIILTGEDYLNCCNTDKQIIRIGMVLNSGFYVRIDDTYGSTPQIKAMQVEALYVTKTADTLEVTAGTRDGQKRQVVKIPLEGKQYSRIGVNVNAGENQYENWLFSHFIQTRYVDPDCLVYYDYYEFPLRNFSNHLVNHFLQFQNETYTDAVAAYGDIIRYIEKQISAGKYLMVSLNEKYIIHRGAYGVKDYRHANLIYGFDDEKQEIYLMGYDENLKLSFDVIGYEVIRESISRSFSEPMRQIAYLPNNETYRFRIDLLLNQIKDYLASVNTRELYETQLPSPEGHFGISAYVKLLNTRKGYERVVTDHRVAYLIYERNAIMLERVRFLYARGYLNEADYKSLSALAEKLAAAGNKLKLFAVKYKQRPSKEIEAKIVENMRLIFLLEYDLLISMYECLDALRRI